VLRSRVVLAGAGLRAISAREPLTVTRGADTLQLGAGLVIDADGGRYRDPAPGRGQR
jgi:hypothetical protein